MIEDEGLDGSETKFCNLCGRALALSFFHKDRRTKDGLRANCKECDRRRVRQNPHPHNSSSNRSYWKHHTTELAGRAKKRAAMNEADIVGDDSFIRRYKAKVQTGEACWEWTAYIGKGGYGQIGFRGGLVYAHRAAWILANGPIPDGLYVCHRCDNRKCCNPEHMFLGTFTDNMNDMFSKGRNAHLSGEQQPRAKLTRVGVAEIRRRYAEENILQEKLAEEYGVSKPAIAALLRNRSWYDPDYVPLPKRIKMSGPNNPRVKGGYGN